MTELRDQARRTGYSGSKARGIENHETVLQAAPAHALSTNQNQRFSLEWWHLRHLFVDLQLMPVELWKRNGIIIKLGNKRKLILKKKPSWLLTSILGRQVHHLLLLFSSYGSTKNPCRADGIFIEACVYATTDLASRGQDYTIFYMLATTTSV